MTGELGPARTLGQMLDEAATRDPSHEAIVFREERVSYGQLKARADAFAFPRAVLPHLRVHGAEVQAEGAYAVEKLGLKEPA